MPTVKNKFTNADLKSQIGYPLNLIVYSRTRLNRPLKKRHCIMQVKSIAECSRPAFSAHLS